MSNLCRDHLSRGVLTTPDVRSPSALPHRTNRFEGQQGLLVTGRGGGVRLQRQNRPFAACVLSSDVAVQLLNSYAHVTMGEFEALSSIRRV